MWLTPYCALPRPQGSLSRPERLAPLGQDLGDDGIDDLAPLIARLQLGGEDAALGPGLQIECPPPRAGRALTAPASLQAKRSNLVSLAHAFAVEIASSLRSSQ